MKISTLIIGVIIIVALVWLGVWWYQNSYTGPVANNTTNNSVTNNTTDNTTANDVGNLINNVISPIVGQTKEVIMSNFSFNPKEITIAKGSTVTFKNNDAVIHDVVFADGQTSGNLSTRATYSRTFNAVGEFNYSCSIHPTMTGKIIVQ